MAKKNTRISTGYPNILITLNDDDEPIGYYLNIRRKNITFNKSFHFKRFGGKDRALIKALKTRDLVYKNPEKVLTLENNKDPSYEKIGDRIYSVDNIYFTNVTIWTPDGNVRKKISVSKDAYTKTQAIEYLKKEREKYIVISRNYKPGSSLSGYAHIYLNLDRHGRLSSYRVTFTKKKVKVDRAFNISKIGGQRKALLEAIKYRDSELNKLK